MKTTTEKLLIVMHVFAWVAFVGLMIEACAFLSSYVVSLINAGGLKHMYKGSNMYNLLEYSFWQYTFQMSFIIVRFILQAYTAYLVIRVLSKIRLTNPFTLEVSRILERISYFILMVWALGLLSGAHAKWLSKTITGLTQHSSSGETLFLAGVVFVMAQIFKKGVEIQSENDLTV